MGLGILLSALLHLCVLVLLIFGAPNWRKTLPEPPKPIPIDIINISELSVAPSPKKTKDITKAAQKKISEPDHPPKTEPIKKEEPTAKEQKPEPIVNAKEEPKVEKTPDTEAIPLPEKKPKPPKKEKIQSEPTPKVPPQKPKKETKKDKPKKEESIKESSKEKKKKSDDFDNVLKAIENLDAVEERQPKTGEMAEKVQANEATLLGDNLSISELDALKRQLSQCWSPPSGMENAETMIVDLHVSLNPDGSVVEVKISDMSRYNVDLQFKPAADAARRAVLNPNCNPLKIPPDKYPQLKSFVLKFDPREMF